jgi:hypothetical protein
MNQSFFLHGCKLPKKIAKKTFMALQNGQVDGWRRQRAEQKYLYPTELKSFFRIKKQGDRPLVDEFDIHHGLEFS